jgi:hypothetical protein
METEILEAIENKEKYQKDIAELYAGLIPFGRLVDWPKINQSIKERWPSKSGLTRVKTMAWRMIKIDETRN